ncbi:MAG: tyrosine-type recombinase/integrase [Anaerolineae bacterium]
MHSKHNNSGLPSRPAPDQTLSSDLSPSLDAFLLSREAMRVSPKTLEHYHYTAGGFVGWLAARHIRGVRQITPTHIRAYLVDLQHRGLKDTTQHAHSRGIKTFLRWLVDEGDLERSPMARVRMPRVEKRIPAPFAPEEIQRLLAACDRATLRGARDYALLLALLDTGLRASELLSLRVCDLDMQTGLCTVLGKGGKQRQVRMGTRARHAVQHALGMRPDVSATAPLWLACDGNGRARGALSLSGLQTLLRRLGQLTGVIPSGPHRFRRTFALWCLRDGMDLHSLRLLMGHADLTVLQRYLALGGEDIERAHAAHSPADRLLGRRR